MVSTPSVATYPPAQQSTPINSLSRIPLQNTSNTPTRNTSKPMAQKSESFGIIHQTSKDTCSRQKKGSDFQIHDGACKANG